MDPPVGRAAMVAPSERLFYTHTGRGTHTRGKSVKRDAFPSKIFPEANLSHRRERAIITNVSSRMNSLSSAVQLQIATSQWSMVIDGQSTLNPFFESKPKVLESFKCLADLERLKNFKCLEDLSLKIFECLKY